MNETRWAAHQPLASNRLRHDLTGFGQFQIVLPAKESLFHSRAGKFQSGPEANLLPETEIFKNNVFRYQVTPENQRIHFRN